MRSARVLLVSMILLAGCKKGATALDAFPDVPATKVTASSKGFEPASIPATQGEPIAIEITRTEEKTCATEALFPDLGLEAKLPLNTPVRISFKPSGYGDIVFSCGMNMFHGTIVVAQK